MVVELCSENCGAPNMSPRISFSHGFSQLDVIPVERHPLRSNSSGLNTTSADFDFCVVQESLEHESSSADELFSDGRILPIEIKNKNKKNANDAPPPPPSLLPCGNNNAPPNTTRKNSKKERTTKESNNKELNNDEVVDEKQGSKSFWSFKRSSSCGSGYGRSLCPLPLLSRSNSTGSSPSVKRVPLSKDNNGPNIKQNSHKNCSSYNTSKTRASSHHSLGPNNHHKPPLKRSHHGSNNGGINNSVRVNPVLNVPPVTLFGFGSIFSNNKDKSKKK